MSDRIESTSKRLEAELSRQTGFDPVSAITTILEAIPDRTAFLQALLGTARRCFLSNHEAILSYHQPTRRWFVEAAADMSDDILEELKGVSKSVMEQTRKSAASLLIPDAQSDERFKESRSIRYFNIQSVLTAPVHVNSELWGLIYLANTSIPNAFDEDSRTQLERFAKFAGMAITRCEEFVRFNLPPLKDDDDAPTILEDVNSSQMADVFALLKQAAPTDASILLQGETGTGKDVLAHWIHQHSPRHFKPMIQINCAELTTNLMEVELFGVESGVATGVSFREGKIKVADGGTIFLNEIGELPLSMQAKILRALDERVVERVGGRSLLGVDVRFVFATNRDLASMVEAKEFRRDLYHRINVFEAHIPTLAERREDIPALAQNILKRICKRQNRPKMRLSKATLEYLSKREWPGNIRELANLIERSVILTPGDELVIGPGDSVDSMVSPKRRHSPGLKQAVADFESSQILRTLQQVGWVEVRAARALGIPEATLRSKMKKYGIKRPRRVK